MIAILAAVLMGQATDQRVGSVAQWIGPDDYPPSLIRAGVEGTVGIEFIIDVDGIISTCTITRTSGNQLLDDTTCNLIKARGRYRPARDAAGKTIPVRASQRVTWAIPREAMPAGPPK
ncbi:energy transducer TonB [Sphingomonas sp. RS2018]